MSCFWAARGRSAVQAYLQFFRGPEGRRQVNRSSSTNTALEELLYAVCLMSCKPASTGLVMQSYECLSFVKCIGIVHSTCKKQHMPAEDCAAFLLAQYARRWSAAACTTPSADWQAAACGIDLGSLPRVLVAAPCCQVDGFPGAQLAAGTQGTHAALPHCLASF